MKEGFPSEVLLSTRIKSSVAVTISASKRAVVCFTLKCMHWRRRGAKLQLFTRRVFYIPRFRHVVCVQELFCYMVFPKLSLVKMSTSWARRNGCELEG